LFFYGGKEKNTPNIRHGRKSTVSLAKWQRQNQIASFAEFSIELQVTVLETHQAVDTFCQQMFELGAGATGAFGAAGEHVPASAMSVVENRLITPESTFSVASGVMLNASLSGILFDLYADRNQTWYGNVSPHSVLDGTIPPPQPLTKLYGALDDGIKRLTARGMT
jgi:lipid-binding SYLF domain-containing protein